jgi:hypothetical protein
MHVADLTQHTRKLSAELHFLAEEFTQHAVELREVIAVLQERAYTLLIVLLALPFCTPIPLPGLSTPLGLVIALLAGTFALGRAPRLPARLLTTRLPPKFFRTLLEATSKAVSFIERQLQPRWLWLTGTATLIRLHAAVVGVAALALLIPAPLPFSNTLPAWGIVLATLGVMQRDGLAILAGYFFTLVGVAYFAVVAFFGVEIFAWLRAWWAGV